MLFVFSGGDGRVCWCDLFKGDGMSTLKQAVKEHCRWCVYDPLAGGNFLEQIEACQITICALYEHRPLTGKTKALLKEKKLALLTHSEREIVLKRREKLRKNMLDLRSSSKP